MSFISILITALFLFLSTNILYNNKLSSDILSIIKLSNLAYSNYDYRFKDYENSFDNIIYLNPKISSFGFVYEE
ncbi:hypothetical protein CRU87_01235 [Aliarcobacter trophiarum LMG 25534]|uniref:Uncharacterized protein n=1 Tax=Aliarcobacter trophiarum LMG 25534 TaxID=1032241 RepID=A0ABY0F2W9_9BACT|nr:hypothetical protein [Aliarcobacter trophiarum]RXI28450.1 hypothetical protein CRU89_00415 [Aliarcobacter trophiarum]RXJ93141.1 hypothetical protein CRU87_01235 [Aliarcobacter trophiarum LMG 25534]